MSHLTSVSTQHFHSEEKATEIEEFFRKTPVPGAERTIQQSLEKVRLSAQILKRDYNQMRDFFEKAAPKKKKDEKKDQ